MRVRQIGTLVFDNDTNIVVDATNQDAPGIGFRVNSLSDPQPFAAEIAFRRATRQAALNAVNLFARELYSYAQRRQNNYLAVAGGALVIVEDANGGTSLRSYLRDSSVTLLGVEATATGVIARVRVAGTLVNPIINYLYSPTNVAPIPPYGRPLVTLWGTSDEYLYKNSVSCEIYNMPGLYNVLFAIEELENTTGTSRIRAINPSSASSGITTQNWNAGWATLTRANFASATSGTITYNLLHTSAPPDVYRLFIEIYCPSTPPSNARYLISWSGQPQIAETISGDRSWYTPTLITPDVVSFPLTLEVQNVPTGTLVMPLMLIPTDGVYVWNVITPPTMQIFQIVCLQYAQQRPFRTVPTGTIYGTSEFVTSRYIAVFFGAMSPSLANPYAGLSIYPARIDPAAFA